MDVCIIAIIVYCTTGVVYALYYLWRDCSAITIKELLLWFVTGAVVGSIGLAIDVIVILSFGIVRLLAPIARIGNIVVYRKTPVDKKE